MNEVGGHCPRCLVEYRPGFDVCSDCDVPLVPGPAPEPSLHRPDEAGVHEGSEPVEVSVVASLLWEEAWLMAGRLRSEGIAAVVSPNDYTSYTYTPRRTFDVVVRNDQAAEATRIVAQLAKP